MTDYQVEVFFTTEYPLTQDTAQIFWTDGYQFHAIPGPRTYEWTAGVGAESPLAAYVHVSSELFVILNKAGLQRADVLKVVIEKKAGSK